MIIIYLLIAKFIGNETTDILKYIKKEGKFTTPNKEVFTLFSKDEIYLINETDNDGNNKIFSCGAANCKDNCLMGVYNNGRCSNVKDGATCDYSLNAAHDNILCNNCLCSESVGLCFN